MWAIGQNGPPSPGDRYAPSAAELKLLQTLENRKRKREEEEKQKQQAADAEKKRQQDEINRRQQERENEEDYKSWKRYEVEKDNVYNLFSIRSNTNIQGVYSTLENPFPQNKKVFTNDGTISQYEVYKQQNEYNTKLNNAIQRFLTERRNYRFFVDFILTRGQSTEITLWDDLGDDVGSRYINEMKTIYRNDRGYDSKQLQQELQDLFISPYLRFIVLLVETQHRFLSSDYTTIEKLRYIYTAVKTENRVISFEWDDEDEQDQLQSRETGVIDMALDMYCLRILYTSKDLRLYCIYEFLSYNSIYAAAEDVVNHNVVDEEKQREIVTITASAIRERFIIRSTRGVSNDERKRERKQRFIQFVDRYRYFQEFNRL